MSKFPHPNVPGYELLRQLGEGGMATVYLATQKSLDRKVAIKVLRVVNDVDPERTERRFLREGRTLAKITHRNVCGIYDIAKAGDIAYIAMEYLDGGTLLDSMHAGISVGESIAVVVQVASALQEAHNQGIVHRDLKPANVMMRGGKIPVITDFGIARELSSLQTKITVENMIVGTPVYMSPEQVSGGEVDGRSDIYSLGIMFFELLTGQPPYRGENPIQLCMQHLTAPLPDLPSELAELQSVLDRMLAKNRDHRYSTMIEFTQALREVFIASSSLRSKAQLAPNQAWSEQLRQMGFSFDTLRDEEFNNRLREQQNQQRLLAQDSPNEPPLALKAAPAQPGKSHGLWLALAALVLLVIGGFWWQSNQKPSKTETLALRGLVREFETQMEAEAFFVPANANVARTLTDMAEISNKSEIFKARLAQFERKILQMITDNAGADRIEAAQELLDKALATELFTQESLNAAQTEISDARSRMESASERAALVQQIEAILAEPNTNLDLSSEFSRLRALMDPDSKELKRLTEKTESKFVARLEIARINEQLQQMQALLANGKLVLPESKLLARYSDELAAIRVKQNFAERVLEVREQLQTPSLGAGELGAIAENLRDLQRSRPADPELKTLRQSLLTRVQQQFESAVQNQQLGLAGSVLDSLKDYDFGSELQPLQNRLSAAKEQARLAEISGTLWIDAQPNATVVSVQGASRVVLPNPANTPLLLQLPEGNYRIEVRTSSGARKSFSGNVTRKKVSIANAGFAELSDSYLKDAGF